MDPLSGLVMLMLVAIVWGLGNRQGKPFVMDEQAFARAHYTEECALCDDDIYVWGGRFLHVSTNAPEASTPHGSPHEAMPWPVHELMRQQLLTLERLEPGAADWGPIRRNVRMEEDE